MNLPHVPILRFGEAYESLDTVPVKDHRNAQDLACISQANSGLIRRDIIQLQNSTNPLQNLPYARILKICKKAAEIFTNENLPLGTGGTWQSPQEYVQNLSATSGLPYSLCWRNMEKLQGVLSEMPKILGGLTRNLGLEILDKVTANQDGLNLCFYLITKALGVVLPSNSPGVNSLWLPSIALKVPVVLKPGSEEPWTPWRLIQALIAAGCPKQAFCFYPTNHDGAETILEKCGRSLIFGDRKTIEQYTTKPQINVHGPGYSKIIVGEDYIDHWPEFLHILLESVAVNSGRSCINASTIIVPRKGRELAESLAEAISKISPQNLEREEAKLSAFPNPRVAEFINNVIEEGLEQPGATDLTKALRKTPRLEKLNSSTFLNPTVIFCDDFNHCLVNREFLFPFVTVVEVPEDEIEKKIGPSLVVTVISEKQEFTNQLLTSPKIERLNIGAIPTSKVEWDQPHEGNLFDFLYKRRAIQVPK